MAPRDAWFVRHPVEVSHPDVVTLSDLDIMMASGAIFACKLDESSDSSVLDRLDMLSRFSQTASPHSNSSVPD